MVSIAARIGLGVMLVLHGLANTVWPLRAVDVVRPGVWTPGVDAIYFAAVVGFVAAGLAVLGDRDLWMGPVLSVVLAGATIAWSQARWTLPAKDDSRWWHRAGQAAGFALLLWVAVAVGLWPHYRTWGATAPEWQLRRVGDLVPATQAGYLGGVFGDRPGWTVAVEPGHALVLTNWGAFVLNPEGDGRTRFLIRSTMSHPRIPAWAAALDLAAFQLPHFIMQRRMMLTIKALAETSA